MNVILLNHAVAHEEHREPLEYEYNAYATWGLPGRRTETTFEEFCRGKFIIGDKASVKEVAWYRELLGVDHFVMCCNWPGLSQDKTLKTVRHLGEIFA